MLILLNLLILFVLMLRQGAHGVLILSPRAVERIESFKSDRPLPKIFRMTKKDKEGNTKIDKGIFQVMWRGWLD